MNTTSWLKQLKDRLFYTQNIEFTISPQEKNKQRVLSILSCAKLDNIQLQQLGGIINQELAAYRCATLDIPSFWGENDQRALQQCLDNNRPYFSHRSAHFTQRVLTPALHQFVCGYPVDLAVVIKLCLGLGLLNSNTTMLPTRLIHLLNCYHNTQPYTLSQLAEVFSAFDLPLQLLMTAYCRAGVALGEFMPDPDVSDFIEQQQLLLIPLLADKNVLPCQQNKLFKALQQLKLLSPLVSKALLQHALDADSLIQQQAQQILAAHVDVLWNEISTYLFAPKVEARTQCALWLAQLQYPATIPALSRAIQEEADASCQAALLEALHVLKQPCLHYINREQLYTQALQQLEQPCPEPLAWFPWDNLPQLHWAEDGSEVAPEIIRSMILQAFHAQSMSLSPLLRSCCKLFAVEERERLGMFVLQHWIEQDLIPLSEAKAIEHAQRAMRYSELSGEEQERLFQIYLSAYRVQPAANAQNCKHILAITIACEPLAATQLVLGYIQKYAYRQHQCCALLNILEQMPHPDTHSYFIKLARKKSRPALLKYEAQRYACNQAKQLGWHNGKMSAELTQQLEELLYNKKLVEKLTMRELIAKPFGDIRCLLNQIIHTFLPDSAPFTLYGTVGELHRILKQHLRVTSPLFEEQYHDQNNFLPNTNLTEQGQLHFYYDQQTVTVQLCGNLLFKVSEPHVSVINKLPASNNDIAAYNLAETQFCQINKLLRHMRLEQTQLLSKSLNNERYWQYSIWQSKFLHHPIFNCIAQQLVWMCINKNISFRPNGPHTLVSADNQPLTLEQHDQICLASVDLLNNRQLNAWQQYFQQHLIQPFFRQFADTNYLFPIALTPAGCVELSLGQHKFTIQHSTFGLELYNEHHELIENLPKLSQEYVETKRWADKQVRQHNKAFNVLLNQQRQRLQQAAKQQRPWTYSLWHAEFLQHRVLRQIAQQCVWFNLSRNLSFRPSEDDSPTDAEHNTLQFEAGDHICLATRAQVSLEQITLWQQHFADYKLFAFVKQFG